MARKVKKRKARINLFVIFLLTAATVVLAHKSIVTIGNQPIFKKEYAAITSLYSSSKITSDSAEHRTTTTPVPASKIEPDPNPSGSISPAKLISPNAILIRLKDNTILMEKKSGEKIYPASLTKMMTAMVALEKLPDLQEEIQLKSSTFQGLYQANAALAGFQPGEQVKAIDLLYGVMLPSGAECCVALAEQIAGSEQNFVRLMIQKAVELGMHNTHFENATGLHNKNHYTTVKDLSVLLSCALHNDTFREIFTSFRYSTQPTNKHPGGITFYHTLYEELNEQNTMAGDILGGKTGYTDEAGLCLASLARVGKQEYILISAGAKGDHHSKQYNIIDALAVYNSIGK